MSYENKAKEHSLGGFSIFPNPVKMTPVFQEIHSLPRGLQGKLPYLSYLLWSENFPELQLWPKAQGPSECENSCEQVCHTGSHSAGLPPLISSSSLRPLTFQSKLQISYIPLGSRNGKITLKNGFKKLQYGTVCFPTPTPSYLYSLLHSQGIPEKPRI